MGLSMGSSSLCRREQAQQSQTGPGQSGSHGLLEPSVTSDILSHSFIRSKFLGPTYTHEEGFPGMATQRLKALGTVPEVSRPPNLRLPEHTHGPGLVLPTPLPPGLQGGGTRSSIWGCDGSASSQAAL